MEVVPDINCKVEEINFIFNITKFTLKTSVLLKKILVQAACMRHPWWRTQAKLAIAFTYLFLVQEKLIVSKVSTKLRSKEGGGGGGGRGAVKEC